MRTISVTGLGLRGIPVTFLWGFSLLLLPHPGITSPPEKKPKSWTYTTFLACQQQEVDFLPKSRFDSLVGLPLCAKDSNLQTYPITSFEITYAERGLYQDSSGLPIIFTDYSNHRFDGNQVSDSWVKFFREHSYRGDTLLIEKVKVKGPDQRSYPAKGLRIVIQ